MPWEGSLAWAWHAYKWWGLSGEHCPLSRNLRGVPCGPATQDPEELCLFPTSPDLAYLTHTGFGLRRAQASRSVSPEASGHLLIVWHEAREMGPPFLVEKDI